MKSIIKAIPNTLTLLNLVSGLAGILFWQHDLLYAAMCVYLAMVFDFFDGFSARLLGATSDIGKQLDSLADLVSFGVLPACILFGVLHPDFLWMTKTDVPVFSFLLIAVPLFSALRLARFNLDETQTYGFKGLPTPANAFWIAAVPFIVMYSPENSIAFKLFSGQMSLVIFALTGSVMLLLPVPLMALKFKSFKWKNNWFRYLFIGTAVMLFIFFKWTGIPIIILAYIVISMFSMLFRKE